MRTLFLRHTDGPVGPEEFANIPPTRFRRKPHWLDARFSGDATGVMPGSHVATPDGRHVFEYAARGEADLAALVKAAAAAVIPDASLVASEQRAVPADGSRLVTTLTRHPGGAAVQVHSRIGESFTLVYDALVSRGGTTGVALPMAVGAGTTMAVEASGASVVAPAEPEVDDAEILRDNLTAGAGLAAGFAKWSPESGETVADRLGAIVGGAMGYEPEDLPWEVPLIELGLDSLMAVRIKNRVEYDFDIPPIQLTAVRDANLYNIEEMLRYAVEHRDEVQALHEHQKTQTPEEIAAEQAALISGPPPRRWPHPRRTRRPSRKPSPHRPPRWTLPTSRSRRLRQIRPARVRTRAVSAPRRLRLRPPRFSPRRRWPRHWAPTSHRGTPPSGSPSRRGRSSPASPRAESSMSCPPSTTTRWPRWPNGSPNAPKASSPSTT